MAISVPTSRPLAKVVREQIPNIDSLSTEQKSYSVFGFPKDDFIKSKVVEGIKDSGVPLSNKQIAKIQVKDGVITSENFPALKEAMGLKPPHDNAMNAQLEAALKNKVVLASIKDNMAAHAAATQVANAPPQPSPEQTVTPPPTTPPGPATEPLPNPTVTAEAPPSPTTPQVSSPDTHASTMPPVAERRWEPFLSAAVEKLGDIAKIPLVQQFLIVAELKLQEGFGKENYAQLKDLVIGTLSKIASDPTPEGLEKTVHGVATAMLAMVTPPEARTPGIQPSLAHETTQPFNGVVQGSEPPLQSRFDSSTYQRAQAALQEYGVDNAVVLGELALPKVPDVRMAQGGASLTI